MIYCIWYPSGGFGHFLNAILTLYCDGFKRPNKKNSFSDIGDSHSLDLIAPKYFHNPTDYYFNPTDKLNYSVIVDNGINDESSTFKRHFNNPKIIKVTYSDKDWPIVAATRTVKASLNLLDTEFNKSAWGNDSSDWAEREAYFLFLRDHPQRFKWKDEPNVFNISVDEILNYNHLTAFLTRIGLSFTNFKPMHDLMLDANSEFIVTDLERIKESKSLAEIDTIWKQAVIYFQIWAKFGIEVPHNTYSDFFKDSDELFEMVLNLTKR